MTFVKNVSRPTEEIIYWTEDTAIGGGDVVEILLPIAGLETAWGSINEDRLGVVTEIKVMITTATDTANTNNIRIGSQTNPNAYTANISTGDTLVAGDQIILDQSAFDADPRIFDASNWIQVGFIGGS